MTKPSQAEQMARPQASDEILERCIEAIPAVMAARGDLHKTRLYWPIKPVAKVPVND